MSLENLTSKTLICIPLLLMLSACDSNCRDGLRLTAFYQKEIDGCVAVPNCVTRSETVRYRDMWQQQADKYCPRAEK